VKQDDVRKIVLSILEEYGLIDPDSQAKESDYYFPDELKLTDRQREALSHLIRGLGLQATANEMGISVSKVIHHRNVLIANGFGYLFRGDNDIQCPFCGLFCRSKDAFFKHIYKHNK